MPTYNYKCLECDQIEEIRHSIHEDPVFTCENCNAVLIRQISLGYTIISGIKGTIADYRESEHTKKVKDPERAIRMRKKAFGHDAVGDPKMQSDPRHIIKRGKALGGQEKEIDRNEFIKAAAKDDHTVNECLKVLKNEI